MDNQEVYYNKYITYKLKYLRLKKDAENNSSYDDEINYLEGLVGGKKFEHNPNYKNLEQKKMKKYLANRKKWALNEKKKLIKNFKDFKKIEMKAYNTDFKADFKTLKETIKNSILTFTVNEQNQGKKMKDIFDKFQKEQIDLINDASKDLKESKKKFYNEINIAFANALKAPIETEYKRQKGDIEKFNKSVDDKLESLIEALNAGFQKLNKKLNEDKTQDSTELNGAKKNQNNLFDEFKKNKKNALDKLKTDIRNEFAEQTKDNVEWLNLKTLSGDEVEIGLSDSPFQNDEPTKNSKWGVKLEDPVDNKQYKKSKDIKSFKKVQNANEFKDAEKIKTLEKDKLDNINSFKQNKKTINAPKELGGKESGRIPPDPFDEKKVADLIKKQLDNLSKGQKK